MSNPAATETKESKTQSPTGGLISTSGPSSGVPSKTASAGESSLASSTSAAPLPSGWPSKIVPQSPSAANETKTGDTEDVDSDTDTSLVDGSDPDVAGEVEHPANSTLISVLLTSAMSWSWLLAQSDASAQVFAYMPVLISEALGIGKEQVKTDSLEAWQPPGWTGSGKDM